MATCRREYHDSGCSSECDYAIEISSPSISSSCASQAASVIFIDPPPTPASSIASDTSDIESPSSPGSHELHHRSYIDSNESHRRSYMDLHSPSTSDSRAAHYRSYDIPDFFSSDFSADYDGSYYSFQSPSTSESCTAHWGSDRCSSSSMPLATQRLSPDVVRAYWRSLSSRGSSTPSGRDPAIARIAMENEENIEMATYMSGVYTNSSSSRSRNGLHFNSPCSTDSRAASNIDISSPSTMDSRMTDDRSDITNPCSCITDYESAIANFSSSGPDSCIADDGSDVAVLSPFIPDSCIADDGSDIAIPTPSIPDSCIADGGSDIAIPTPSIPDSCIAHDGRSSTTASITIPDEVRNSSRSYSSHGSSATSEDSVVVRISNEDRNYLHAQARDYVYIDALSVSSSYDADVETVSSENRSVPDHSCARNITKEFVKKEYRLIQRAFRNVVITFVTSIITLGIMAITKAIDPQLSSFLGLLIYRLSYFFSMAMMVLLILITCANAIRAFKSISSKCSCVMLFVTSAAFIALALFTMERLVKFLR